MKPSNHSINPPQWPLTLLRWFCPDSLYETIEGDLIEQFEADLEGVGEKKAKRRFCWNVIKFLRPAIILRNKASAQLNQFDMILHFLTIFVRNARKNISYTFINVAGLAVGLASSIFILLWVANETSFDQFHKNKERIFQIKGHHVFPSGTETYNSTPGPLAAALKELPEVEESCRIISQGGRVLFQYKDQSIYEEGVYADPSVFSVFTIPIAEGDHINPLPDNNSIAISQKLATKYFRGESAMGKIFRLNNNLDAKVTAVFNDLPENSSLQFEFILPYRVYALTDQYNDEWGAWTGGDSYVRLRSDANKDIVSKKINETFTRPRIWPRWDTNVQLFLFPFLDLRLYDNFKDGRQEGGRIIYVRAFSLVAIFILLIACINFMNLATARAMGRAKEIGVRKVTGALRKSLIWQFLVESVLISFISLFFSLLIVYALLPSFNTLVGKRLTIDYANPLMYVSLLSLTLFTGLIAGSYPAFFLSSLRAIQVLKRKISGLGGVSIRKVLVVFQFSLSVILIISALVVYKQIEYMRSKNLGFDKDNVFYIRSNDGIRKTYEGFKNEALQNPVIRFVALADDNPMEMFGGMVLTDNAWPGKTKEDNIVFYYLQCDEDFLPALDFKILEGRNFSHTIGADSNNYIISKEAARVMKLRDPIGQQLAGPHKGQIIGVVNDFHSTGLQGPIQPVIISMHPENARRIFIRYQPAHMEEALNYIQGVYKKHEPSFPMEYKFLDEPFGRQYQNEILIGKLSVCFTLMATFISCLGLFGLASFTAERRAKEIGVRKVLGATVSQIVGLLCHDFILLIAIALGIGLPLAWWGSQKFLGTYQFHTDMSISLFVATALFMLLIALLTVSYQSAKAARANPVDTLLYE